MKIAVLGCGPAGLLATHAAVRLGHDPVVFSVAIRSTLSGAMYLHRSIPEISGDDADGIITYRKLGTREGYAQKVYHNPKAKCSWDEFHVGEYPAWSLQAAYDRLWERYRGLIQNRQLSAIDADEIAREYPLVISSLPAASICRKPYHVFKRVHIWVEDSANSMVQEGHVIYSGRPSDHWYRSSRIFGHESTEYPHPLAGASAGYKPISHDCDCWLERNLIPVGRFGTWTKGVLSHHAYESTIEQLEEHRAVHTL